MADARIEELRALLDTDVEEVAAQALLLLAPDVRRLVQAVGNTNFDCGAWTDADEAEYEAVYHKSLRAEALLALRIAELCTAAGQKWEVQRLRAQ